VTASRQQTRLVLGRPLAVELRLFAFRHLGPFARDNQPGAARGLGDLLPPRLVLGFESLLSKHVTPIVMDTPQQVVYRVAGTNAQVNVTVDGCIY